MKIIHQVVAVLLLTIPAAFAQTKPLEFGVKGGATFTHGFTVIPAQPTGIENVEVPKLENQSNGIGYGYSAGLWARRNFSNFFVQAEVTYNTFLLKQKTNTTLDVNANPALSSRLPISIRPGLVSATLNLVSESALESVNVPILIGKRWLGGRLRGYAGPNFLFVTKAEVRRVTTGSINGNPTLGFPSADIPETRQSTNLLNRYEADFLEVKDFTYALELGVGVSPIRRLDVDVRYAVPVGGVYKDNDVTGFLGIATVTLGYRLF